ncbi:hypothetical protein D3C71_174640 [compost metagenome]
MSDADVTRAEFLGRISFRPSAKKLGSCLRFLRLASPGVSHEDLQLALLLAEGSHISAYGRPVAGCQYILSEGAFLLSGQADVAEMISREDTAGAAFFIDDIDAMEEVFPNLSGSDIEHMTQAAMLCATDRDAGMAMARAWLHEGMADYALMLEDDDVERLRSKLEDLSFWGKYIYLGK